MDMRHAVWGMALALCVAGPASAHVIGESSDDHPDYDPAATPPVLRPLHPLDEGAGLTPAQLLGIAAAVLDGNALRPVAAVERTVAQAGTPSTAQAQRVEATFAPFAPAVRTRFDDRNFYVESNGMPNHPMMVGITAWQQQVPVPQTYTGNNAWRFPLTPQPAAVPLSAREHFFRGAIAIAADGVPIFNPIKNDGRTDTFLAGELDTFGGHAGQIGRAHV